MSYRGLIDPKLLSMSWADAADKDNAAAAVAPAARRRSRNAAPALPRNTRRHRSRTRSKERKQIAQNMRQMVAIMKAPKEGDVIYDPTDRSNPEKVLIFHEGDWVQAFDPFGDYGGPYATERQLLADPGYRRNIQEFEELEARRSGRDRAANIVAGLMSSYNGPAEKRSAAETEALRRVREAMEKGEGDATKLGALARRGMKVALKGGARRTRRAN